MSQMHAMPDKIADLQAQVQSLTSSNRRLVEALEFVAREHCGRSVNNGGPCPRFSPVGTPITCEHIVAREALAENSGAGEGTK